MPSISVPAISPTHQTLGSAIPVTVEKMWRQTNGGLCVRTYWQACGVSAGALFLPVHRATLILEA